MVDTHWVLTAAHCTNPSRERKDSSRWTTSRKRDRETAQERETTYVAAVDKTRHYSITW